jgi:hypothetical protein
LPVENGASCGLSIWLRFLEAPQAALDDRCVAQISPLSFRGTAELARAVFGTEHLWENGQAHSAPALGDASVVERLRGIALPSARWP